MHAHSRIAGALTTALLATPTGRAQQACMLKTETKPSMTWQKCDDSGCATQTGSVVIDANWRWTHGVDSTTNCYTGNTWDSSLCPDDETCAKNCCLDGADYQSTYGVTTSDDSINLNFITQSEQKNVGSRLFLMASENEYQGFELLGKEFSFNVDVSKLGCGLNGALYFVSMDLDGGLSKHSGNTAGAKYGTGYCDSQCPRDLKFIDGQGNVEDWQPSSDDVNTGVGKHGSCCPEMDIWEANKISASFTPHPCSDASQHMCEGEDCGGTYSSTRYGGTCDPDGCDFNSYRQGDSHFYGQGQTVDTSSVFTVVTQFLTDASGDLAEIVRFYVQDNKVIKNSQSTIYGTSGNSITPSFCDAQKAAFGDPNVFAEKGGFSSLSKALSKPVVLVMSLWDDHYSNMRWLDSTYPVNSTKLGAIRGTCDTNLGQPSVIEADQADARVIYSNIRFGPIDGTRITA